MDPATLGQLPDGPKSVTHEADFLYTGTEQHRLWQVWIDTSLPDLVIELEVKYPEGVLQNSGRGYIFRLALSATTGEADQVNTAFSGELTDEDGIILHTQQTYLLSLDVAK